RFRYPERQGEEPIFGAALRALKERAEIDTIMKMPDGVWLEGAGDCIWDPGAPPVLDGLRATLASRGGSGRRGERRHRMHGLGAFQRQLLSPRHGALSFALRRRDLLPWRFCRKRVARHRGVRRSRASPDNRS